MQVRRVLLLALGTFALGLDAYVLTGLLPGISTSLHTSLAAAGQVVTGFTLSYALLSPVLAASSATVNRKFVLIGGLVIFALANLASAASPQLRVLILCRVVAGAAAGIYSPSAAATATQLVPAGQRGRALSVVLGGLTIATVIGVPVGVLLAVHTSWRATLLLVAGLAVLASLGIAIFLPRISAPPPPGLRQRFTVLAQPWILGRISVMLLLGIANLGLYTYLAVILRSTAGISSGSLPGYLLAWGAAGAVGNIFVGWLLDHGRRAGLLLGGVIVVLAAALYAIPAAASSPAGVVIVLLAWGGTAWSLQVPLQYQLTKTFPGHAPTTVALLASSVYLGSALGSILDGALLSATAPKYLPLAAGSIALLAFIVNAATARIRAGTDATPAAAAAADRTTADQP